MIATLFQVINLAIPFKTPSSFPYALLKRMFPFKAKCTHAGGAGVSGPSKSSMVMLDFDEQGSTYVRAPWHSTGNLSPDCHRSIN